MDMYKQIIEIIGEIEAHMRSSASRGADWGEVERIVDDRLIQALDTAAQKAADLAVIATDANDRELYELLYGLKRFGHKVGIDRFAVVSPGYDVDGDY